MRPLEILIPIVLAIYMIFPITGKKRPFIVELFPAFTLMVIVAHASLEGMRWQMIPLYAFTLIALIFSIPALFGTAKNEAPTRRPFRIVLSFILLAVSTALPILLPVPAIPAPSGPYPVGTRIYELTDTSRKELYSGKDEDRRFQIQVWYPAEVSETDERAPWMARADIYGPALSEFLQLPSFFMDHLKLVKLPAYQEAKVASTAEEGSPIILFSHGWRGFNAQNTGQALELASHGYVVVGVQHTYGALVTVFDDGTIAKYNPSALPSGVPDDEYDVAAHLLSDQWAGDLGFALDFLDGQNTDAASPFYSSLDPSRIGVYGHSTGGGAAIQFCGTDERCKALFGMDPYMRPAAYEILEKGMAQPSFHMFSQGWADRRDSENNLLFDPFYANSAETYGSIYIEGTEHYDFSDMPLFTPLAPQLGLKGPINGKRVTIIINDYLLSFFDLTLKGIPTDLFDKQSPYPEVQPKP